MRITEATVKLTDKGNGLLFTMQDDTGGTDKVYMPFLDGTVSPKGSTARGRAMERLSTLSGAIYDELTNPVEFAKTLVGCNVTLDDAGRYQAAQ